MRISPAHPSDEPRIKKLLSACDLPVEDITPSHLEHYLVIRQDGKLTGVVGLEPLGKSALLRSLAVSENIRKRGVASRLVKRAEEYAKAKEIDSLYLLATTAAVFFEKQGFARADRSSVPTAVQETAEFKNICPKTAICMVKSF